MVADPLEPASRVVVRVAPGVVDVQRSAVIDQPRTSMPDEQVRIDRSPVRVGDERVKPDDVRRGRRIDQSTGGVRGRVEGQRAGQEVHPQVQATARAQQVVDLLIRVRIAQGGVHLDRHQVRHVQADRPGELAGQPLRDEGPRSLAGPAELDDVEAVVVGLDEPWQRPAFAQRRDVACRSHGPQRHPESLAQTVAHAAAHAAARAHPHATAAPGREFPSRLGR